MTENANANSADLRYYDTDDSLTRVAFRVVDGTLWMTSTNIAALYRTSEQDVARQLKAAFCGRRVGSASIRKETRDDSAAPIQTYYALDAVLLVGTRLGSPRTDTFARWAAQRLAEEPGRPADAPVAQRADRRRASRQPRR